MFLEQLSLINYKNLDSRDFGFCSKVNCFVGPNGIGKTNVLDAIYHLSFGKSYFNPIASQNIRHGADFFVIDGEYNKEGKQEKVICSLKKGQKKIIKRNGKPYEKLADHIGLFPLVIISPADRDLIIEGSDTRRKFMDGVISQSDKNYLELLLKYNRVLGQRNSLLKYFAANHTFDPETLAVYNAQLKEYGNPIFEKRAAFIESFTPIFQEQHQQISGNGEQVSLVYESKLHQTPFGDLLEQNIDKDRALQYTGAGIHKDDLSFDIHGHPIKKFGSQGQQKTYLIALKLAQFHFIQQHCGLKPILVLDDIFDKLDEHRVAHIVGLVDQDHFGQIFISDTHGDRTESIVADIHQSYKIFNLGEDG